ncbi:terminase large subunit [Novosphingobium sp. Gsoil 351]|uniref:terminase large subunit n=1 Tax=Novosphingobium sp. Gsoil 351 TaxID=2675225 RepID=UPI0018A7FF78|nr:terminase large subunit [Novosphingobium sp. Gsoil 351]
MGFDIAAAIKGAGSVEDGIEFLKNYDIVVHPRCKHLADELVMYRWSTDRQTGVILPKPADAHNHVIDSLRYGLEGVRKASAGEPRISTSGPRVSLARPGAMGHDPFRRPEIDVTKGWGTVPSRRSGILWD